MPTNDLSTLAPTDFLQWENFLTLFDGARAEGYRLEQYRKGFDTGVASMCVFISANGTWGAQMKDGSQLTACEKIGYHAGTADLLHGFLDSGVPIKVFRYGTQEGVLINKPNPRITTTFSVVTHESAEQGDTAERGYADEEGESCLPDEFDIDEGVTIVDKAVDFLRNHGACEPSSSQFHVGVWYDGSADHDFRTGDYRTESYHLNGFTPEEEGEIYRRLFPLNR